MAFGKLGDNGCQHHFDRNCCTHTCLDVSEQKEGKILLRMQLRFLPDGR